LLLLFVSNKYPQRKNHEESSITKGDVIELVSNDKKL